MGAVDTEGGEENTTVGPEIGDSGTGGVDLIEVGDEEGGDCGNAVVSEGPIVFDQVSSFTLGKGIRFCAEFCRGVFPGVGIARSGSGDGVGGTNTFELVFGNPPVDSFEPLNCEGSCPIIVVWNLVSG